VTKLPTAIVGAPDFSTFFAPFQTVKGGGMALLGVFTPSLLLMVFAIMLTDFFDTMGTVVAVGEQAGFVGPDGKVPDIKPILLVDSAAAAVGGLFGASSITTYIESAAGVAEGGRTGLTPIVTGVLFAISAFFAPVIAMIGGGYQIPNATQYTLMLGSGFKAPEGMFYVYPITACALIVVGFLMMRSVREIPWTNFEEAFPAFLAIVGIPLTYNISYGIGMGFISYTVIKLLHRKGKEVHPLMYVVSAAFVLVFIMPALQGLLAGK
jgi:AGZA family xanthine/uracil permease-like MFS transporter